MIDEKKYEDIRKSLVSKLILKRNLYILFSILDIIAAIIVVVKLQNYYSLLVFGAMLIYFIIEFVIYKKVISKEEYVIAELTCDGISRSQFGYSFTNSKIYDFVINSINNQAPKIVYNSWITENNIKNAEEFTDKIQLQFTYNMRLVDIKKSFREKNLKYNKDDKVYMLFMTNKKRPLNFTNTTMLVY